jgi:hypothetical protein
VRIPSLLSKFANTQWKRIQVILITGLFFFLAPLLIPFSAQAITVSPPRLELEGDPGTTIESEFKVTNESSVSQNYYTQVENFEAKDESGNPQFVQTKEGLAIWTGVTSSVTVAPNEEKTIPFSIRIPRNAEPGGYFASIFVRTTPPPTGSGEVSVGARLGTLVLLRVNGEIREGVDILEFGTKDKNHIFNSLPIEFYYRFQNRGADRVKPSGDVLIKDIFGLKAKVLSANPQEGSVLPQSIRRFSMAWITGGGGQEDATTEVVPHIPGGFLSEARYQLSHFAVGMYTAKLDITFGQNNNNAQSSFRFFVFPWQLLSIVIGGGIILIIVFRFLLKRYNRYIISKHT